MTVLHIPGMNCDHCTAAVQRAIGTVDPGAETQVDLESKTATVRSEASPDALIAALSSEGYPATIAA